MQTLTPAPSFSPPPRMSYHSSPTPRPLRLSPSTLNIFRDCPRCFWLKFKRGLEPPSGPMPSITNGIDHVLKEYMNRYRAQRVMAPILVGKVPGTLINFLPSMLSTMIDGVTLCGKLDECLVLDDRMHAPLDHKSKGFPPRTRDTVHPAYQLQMDCYTLLLERNNLRVNGTGYIVYYYPDVGELHGGFPFRAHVCKLETDPRRAVRIFRDALACLKGDEMPATGTYCGVCHYTEKRKQH